MNKYRKTPAILALVIAMTLASACSNSFDQADKIMYGGYTEPDLGDIFLLVIPFLLQCLAIIRLFLPITKLASRISENMWNPTDCHLFHAGDFSATLIKAPSFTASTGSGRSIMTV
jgi:hypothetical protein